MFSQFRTAIGITLLLTLITSVSVFAKGGFAFVSISGADLKEPIRSTDPALTMGYFAFADFYRNQTEAPVNPGIEYEITRYYMDGGREYAFDRLHYYPITGYLYYDGLVNGSSEYDGHWYKAQPEIKAVFESLLLPASVVITELDSSASQPQPNNSTMPTEPVSLFTGPQLFAVFSLIVGSAVITLLAYWRRRALTH